MRRLLLAIPLFVLTLCLGPARAAMDSIETQSATLRYSESTLPPGWEIDAEDEISLSDSARLTYDVLFSLGEHTINAPYQITAAYDAAEVMAGNTVEVTLRLETMSSNPSPLQDFSAGFEGNVGVKWRTWLLAGYTDWNSVTLGADYGIDFDHMGVPPMAGEDVEDDDSIGLIDVFHVAEDNLIFGTRLYDGYLAATLTSSNGNLMDCAGNAVSSITVYWPSRGDTNCVLIGVPMGLAQGDELDLTFSDLYYEVGTKVPLHLVATFFGNEFPRVPIGTIPTAPLTATGADVALGFPVQAPPLDLIAHHVGFSADATNIHPEQSFQVLGYLVNNSSTIDSPDAEVILETRPVGGAWSELATFTEAVPLNRSRYVVSSVAAGTFAPGDYQARMRVDPSGQVAEADETNNNVIANFTIINVLPDLTVVQGSVQKQDGPVRADEDFSLSAVAQNSPRATLSSTSTTVRFEVQNDDDTWSELGTTSIEAVAPDSMTTATIVVSANTLDAGSHLVRAIVDPDDTVNETADYNNESYGGVFLRPAAADMHVDPLDLTFFWSDNFPNVPPLPTSDVTAILEIHNVGDTNASGVDVDFYRRTGNGPDDLVHLTTDTAVSIVSGSSGFTSVSFRPEDFENPGGWWAIEAHVERIGNENETDNEVIRSVWVGTPTAHLEGRVESAADHSLLTGADVTITSPVLSTLSVANGTLPNAAFANTNYRIESIPVGPIEVTASLAGYESQTRTVDLLTGHSVRLDFELEPTPPADLQGRIFPDPPIVTPGSVSQFLLHIRNTGGTPVTTPFEVAFILDEGVLGNFTVGDTIPPGGEVVVQVPNGPYAIPTDADMQVGAELDVTDQVVEISEGNNTTSTTVTNPKPEITIDSISPDPAPFGTAVEMVATVTDDGPIHAYEWLSSLDGMLGGSEDITVAELSPGDHEITLRARDEHGEWSEETTTLRVTDSLGPDVRLLHQPSPLTTAPASVSFVWVADDDVTVQSQLEYAWYLDGVDTGYGDWSSTREAIYLNLTPGDYTLYIKARDAAGNESSSPLSYAFTALRPKGGDNGGCSCSLSPRQRPWTGSLALVLLLAGAALLLRRGTTR